jgi:AcrR family transcriptional regulator
MARTAGSRNAGYEEQRLTLARKAAIALRGDGGTELSLRDLAAAADTSVATLRHYFKDRGGLLQAVMEVHRADAAPFLAMAAQAKVGDVRRSLLDFLKGFSMAWVKHDVGRMYASTFSLGLAHQQVGFGFVSHVLEPVLQTGETMLRQHAERGELRLDDVRHASLMFLSPVVLALLHQHNLDGARCRPLDLGKMLETHVDAFLRAFGTKKARA